MPENFNLPVVQKAQPLMVAWESRTFVQNPSEQELSWGKDGTVSIVSNYLAVERERAGYEKREQTLKNKIKEQALRIRKTLNSFEDLTTSFHYSTIQGAETVEGFNYSDLKAQLEEREKELLGLSKQ